MTQSTKVNMSTEVVYRGYAPTYCTTCILYGECTTDEPLAWKHFPKQCHFPQKPISQLCYMLLLLVLAMYSIQNQLYVCAMLYPCVLPRCIPCSSKWHIGVLHATLVSEVGSRGCGHEGWCSNWIFFCPRLLLRILTVSRWSGCSGEEVEQREAACYCFYVILRGKLVDYYMKLGEDNLTDTEVLKKALSTRAGMTTDLLTSDVI